jgi:hypothetical protein
VDFSVDTNDDRFSSSNSDVSQVLISKFCLQNPLFALLGMTHGPAFVLQTRINAESSPSSIRTRAFVNTTHISSA